MGARERAHPQIIDAMNTSALAGIKLEGESLTMGLGW